jgi:hypothetical protein
VLCRRLIKHKRTLITHNRMQRVQICTTGWELFMSYARVFIVVCTYGGTRCFHLLRLFNTRIYAVGCKLFMSYIFIVFYTVTRQGDDDGVWIGYWIYWTRLQLVTTLYKSVTQRLVFSFTLLGSGLQRQLPTAAVNPRLAGTFQLQLTNCRL